MIKYKFSSCYISPYISYNFFPWIHNNFYYFYYYYNYVFNYYLKKNNFYSNKIINHQLMETIWTIFPLLILMFLAIPLMKILYLTEELSSPNMSLKAIGNQWYWSYEYPEFKKISFDSYMVEQSLGLKNPYYFRLLDVDNRVILPIHLKIRLLITSNDVIHSFAIPSMGIKTDAIPERINQSFMFISLPGNFFGQCSEICGMNHSFMPIAIESIAMKYFYKWMKWNT